jgi:flagella basal body P-ring formation protein FlgA
MMKAALFLLLVTLAPAARAATELPPEVQAAMDGAVALSGARVVPISYQTTLPRNCRPTTATLPRPIDGTGRFAVQLDGEGCRGWAWLKVEVWAPVMVTTRAVRAGEAIDEAVTAVERQVTAGNPPPALAPGAVAARSLPRGKAVQASDVRMAAAPSGGPIKVLVRSGPLVIETSGRLITCGRGRTCAVLTSGKHVEGQLADGRLVVDVP